MVCLLIVTVRSWKRIRWKQKAFSLTQSVHAGLLKPEPHVNHNQTMMLRELKP